MGELLARDPYDPSLNPVLFESVGPLKDSLNTIELNPQMLLRVFLF